MGVWNPGRLKPTTTSRHNGIHDRPAFCPKRWDGAPPTSVYGQPDFRPAFRRQVGSPLPDLQGGCQQDILWGSRPPQEGPKNHEGLRERADASQVHCPPVLKVHELVVSIHVPIVLCVYYQV